MRMSRIYFGLLLLGAFFIAAALPSWAAESWVVDPKTGCRIGWVSEISTLINANWSGRQVQGKADGRGNLRATLRDNESGSEYQIGGAAEMVAGKLDGKVSLKYSLGISYDGLYKAGIREGRGTVILSNGDSYDGEWKNDKWSGRGLFKYADGSIYEGEFESGNMTGQGVRKWPDGRTYEGRFRNGVADGNGRLGFANGATYEGGVVGFRPSGTGVLKDPRGAVIHSGDWKDWQDESMQQFGEATAPLAASVPSTPAASPAAAPATALAPPTLPAPEPRAQAPTREPSVSSGTALLRELRERLYELNFDPAAADAPFVEADRRAIREFEEKNNLPQTGEVTVALLNNLRAAGGQSPWGAIVFAKSSGKWGMAWAHASRKEAVASAVSTCGDARQCTVELSFFGTECGAFAYSGTTWALSARADADKAKEAALADCQKGGRSCRVVASVCAGGSDRSQAEKRE